MKNKGYTLIELLGVMIILAVLITLVFPSIIDFIKKSNGENDKLVEELVYSAAESYIEDNSKEMSSIYGNTYCISISDLINKKYLKNVEIDLNKRVKVTYTNKFSYELVEEDFCIDFVVKLEPNLIPVIYNGDNWIVADTNKEWYNYEKQEWANAVILNSSAKKKVGDIVTVDGTNPDALAMFVWIPRYEYKIEGAYGKGGTSATSPGEIEVNFISITKTENTNGYRVHPAFLFGIEQVPGIWVGKFELSNPSNVSGSLGCTNETCPASNSLRILPNVRSLRQNSVSSLFFAIRSMSMKNNIFGIDSNKLDSHMIKNSEWGAVAYLTQSKYGKYGNTNYKGADKEVYINNSSRDYTGRSGGSYSGNTAINTVYMDQESEQQTSSFGFYTYDGYLLTYDSGIKTEKREVKKVASTTGNITGIYDMSGNNNEYVMGVFVNSDGNLWTGSSLEKNSGFKGKVDYTGIDIDGLEWPNKKYYQTYNAHNGLEKSCNGNICYGDSLSETSNWYGDYAAFIGPTYPWIVRGGEHHYGSGTGLFFYSSGDGAEIYNSTRVVLVPIN